MRDVGRHVGGAGELHTIVSTIPNTKAISISNVVHCDSARRFGMAVHGRVQKAID